MLAERISNMVPVEYLKLLRFSEANCKMIISCYQALQDSEKIIDVTIPDSFVYRLHPRMAIQYVSDY